MSKPTLSERMTGVGAVNLHPRAKEKRVAEVLPDMREVITDSVEQRQLIQLVEMEATWSVAESEAKAMRKPIKEKIKSILGGVSKFMVGSTLVNYYSVPKHKLDDKKILKFGHTTLQTFLAARGYMVPAGVLMAAVREMTVACTTSYTQLQLKVTAKGQEEEEDASFD